MARDKMVRVSERELELLRRAKKAIERRGYALLEEDLEEVLQEESEEDYDEQEEDLGEFLAGLALGAIAAVGAIALLRMLSEGGAQ